MIADLSGGQVLRGIIPVGSGFKPDQSIKISTIEITNLLGIEIKPPKIKSILQSLGFGVAGSGRTTPNPSLVKEGIIVKIPSWRADVSQASDIVEEIGRMVDYNTLPKTLPSGALQSKPVEPLQLLRRNLRKYLTSAGYSEILTYSFYDEKLLALSGASEDKHIKVVNPVNSENKYLRTSLLPWMLAKLSQNSALLSNEQFQLFEIGKVFSKPNHEKWQLVVGLIDTTASDEVLYRCLRGISEFGEITIYPKGKVPGMRFRSSVGVLLVDLDELLKNLPDERRKFKSLPFYPQVERDLAMVVPNNVEYKEIEEEIKKHDTLLKAVVLFDVYHGLNEGKSLAFRLTFGSTDKTLESKEVDGVIENLKQSLTKKLKVSFR